MLIINTQFLDLRIYSVIKVFAIHSNYLVIVMCSNYAVQLVIDEAERLLLYYNLREHTPIGIFNRKLRSLG